MGTCLHLNFSPVDPADVHALLLSDVFVFLQEKDQKYVFAMLVRTCCHLSLLSSHYVSCPLPLLPSSFPSMCPPSLLPPLSNKDVMSPARDVAVIFSYPTVVAVSPSCPA